MRSKGNPLARVPHSVPDCQALKQLLTIRPPTMRLASPASLATIRNNGPPTMSWAQTVARLTFRNNGPPTMRRGQTSSRLTFRNNPENLARDAKQRETLKI